MGNTSIHKRFIQPRLLEVLVDSPVVLIHGPRQCGKTTLAKLVGGDGKYGYNRAHGALRAIPMALRTASVPASLTSL